MMQYRNLLTTTRVYSLQSTVYSLQSTVYSLQSTVYSLQSTVYSLKKNYILCLMQALSELQKKIITKHIVIYL